MRHFSKILGYIKTVFEGNFPISEQKKYSFLKKKKKMSCHAGWEGFMRRQCHQVTRGKKGQKVSRIT